MAADGLLVGAVISWAIYIILSKPLVVRHGALPVLAGTFLLGSLLSVPIAIFSLPAWPAIGHVSSTAWLALAFLTFFVTPLGQACQNLALSRLDASQVANFSNASPILTVVWGIWLFGEALTPALLIGGILTFGGISCASRRLRRPPTREIGQSSTTASSQVTRAGWLGSSWRQLASPQSGSLGPESVAPSRPSIAFPPLRRGGQGG
jgi:drug/metabolite transporter (DMT)-like permease